MPPTNNDNISNTKDSHPPTIGITNDIIINTEIATPSNFSDSTKEIGYSRTIIHNYFVYCENTINIEPAYLGSCPLQTHKLCMIAVKKNGLTLKYVQNQNPVICMAAVQQNGYALQFVKSQTPEICLAAVQEIGLALKYVKYQTPEICMAAILNRPMSFEFVESKTYDICKFAYTIDIETARFMPNTNKPIQMDDCEYSPRSPDSPKSSGGGCSVGSSGLSCGYSHSTSENYSRKHAGMNITARSLFNI